MQQLYVASSEQEPEITNQVERNIEEEVDQSQDDGLSRETENCVVCQENSITIAILPCKHTCICTECLHKLHKCPMCRSFIQSFFSLTDQHMNSSALPTSDRENDREVPNWWVRLNQRINSFVGLR